MITLTQFKELLLESIKSFNVDILNKIQNEHLRLLFKEVLESDTSLHLMLNHLLVQANSLINSDAFLNQVPRYVQNIATLYFHNEFKLILGDYFEPEIGKDVIQKEDIQSTFSRNLVAQMNTLIAKQFGEEFEKLTHPTPPHSSKLVSFEDENLHERKSCKTQAARDNSSVYYKNIIKVC